MRHGRIIVLSVLLAVAIAGCTGQPPGDGGAGEKPEEPGTPEQPPQPGPSAELPVKLTASTYKVAEGYTGFFKGTAKQYYSVVKKIIEKELPGACVWEVNTGLTYIDMNDGKLGELTHGWHYYYTTGEKGLLVSISKELDSTEIIATLTPDTIILPVSGLEEKKFTPAQTSECIDFDSFVDHNVAGEAALASSNYFSTSYSFRAVMTGGKDVWELKSSKSRSPGAGLVTILVDGKTGALA